MEELPHLLGFNYLISKDYETHLKNVEVILSALQQEGLSLKLNKCKFFQDSVEYLGHINRPRELHVHPKNVSALAEAKPPRTQTELRSFMGICNVYRRFVDHFAKIAAPLTSMLQKGQSDLLPDLDEERRSAFETVKTCLISPPVLRLSRLELPYYLDTDASDAQLGCTLLQQHEDGNRYPIGFWSRTLLSEERY